MSQNGNQPTSGSDPRSSGTQTSAATPAISQQDNPRTHGDMSSTGAARNNGDGTDEVSMFGTFRIGVARTIGTRHLTD